MPLSLGQVHNTVSLDTRVSALFLCSWHRVQDDEPTVCTIIRCVFVTHVKCDPATWCPRNILSRDQLQGSGHHPGLPSLIFLVSLRQVHNNYVATHLTRFKLVQVS